MQRSVCALVVALAGCPASGRGVGPAPVPPGAGVGCPAATEIYVASYLTAEDGAGDGKRRHAGWVLPLHDLAVDAVANQPEYAAIDATTAGALGVPVAPAAVWLMVPGQPACRATVGSYYAAAVDGGPPNVTYGAELTGCPAPPADQQQDAAAIALVSEAPPTACQVIVPSPVAARLGETDAQGRWQRPTRATPVPPQLAGAIPARDCQAPGCEALWAFAHVEVGGRPVAWAGAINWLTVAAAEANPCAWKADTFAGFFVAGPDGRATRVTEGQDHPLLLTAVLADATGPRALIAEGAGEYATYDLSGGGARLARHLVWLRLAPEAYVVDERLGPTCDAASR